MNVVFLGKSVWFSMPGVLRVGERTSGKEIKGSALLSNNEKQE